MQTKYFRCVVLSLFLLGFLTVNVIQTPNVAASSPVTILVSIVCMGSTVPRPPSGPIPALSSLPPSITVSNMGTFTSGKSLKLTMGPYIIKFNPGNGCTTFVQWTTNGKLSIKFPTRTPTTLSVQGAGTLTAMCN